MKLQLKFNTYEKKGVGVGIALTLLLLLFMQLGLATITGSLPDIIGLILGLIGCCKYIGKGFDSVAELLKRGNTTNQKLATFAASLVGIGLALAAYFAHFELLQSIIHIITESSNLPTWMTLPMLFLGLAGTAAAAGDKLGQFVDNVTQQTAVDAGRSVGKTLNNCFTKKNNEPTSERILTTDANPNVAKEIKANESTPLITSPSKSINTIPLELIALQLKPPTPGKFEQKGVIIGLGLALVILVVILAGVTPIPGGLPAILGLMFGLIGCPKYIGKAIDCLVEIKKEGKTTNQKLATLGGCFVGLGLAIASIFLPGFAFLNTTINALIQVVQLPAWIHTPFIFLGLIGTAAGGADKIGQFVDGFTDRTIIDAGRSLFNGIKNCFAKKSSVNIDSIEVSETPKPNPSQQNTNSASESSTKMIIQNITTTEVNIASDAKSETTEATMATVKVNENGCNVATTTNGLVNKPLNDLGRFQQMKSSAIQKENPKVLSRTFSLNNLNSTTEKTSIKRQLSLSLQ